MKKIQLNFLLFCLITISVFVSGSFIDSGKIMTPEVTVPYFSGAALFNFSKEWKFNLDEVDSISKISAIQDKSTRRKALNNFHFSDKPTVTRNYEINQPGFRYIISIATILFPQQGQIGSAKSFQLFIHALLSFLILISLTGKIQKRLFYFFYILNPLIIYYALFPFYYFWQVIPSFLLLLFYLNKNLHKHLFILISAIILAFIYHTRVTTIGVSLLVFVFGFHSVAWWKRLSGAGLMIILIIIFNPTYLSKHPGHVMYSSMGAYGGLDVEAFSDNISFRDYNLSMDKNYSYNTTPGFYDSEVIMGESKWGMSKFLEKIKEKPLLIFRNAFLNLFESFSFGYSTGSIWVTYLSALSGFILMLLLIINKMWKEIVFIFSSVVLYIFYLAPVPVYLYGTYLLLVYSYILLFQKITSKKIYPIRN